MDSIEKQNFILYLSGKVVSLLGTSIYTFAIGFYILKETGSGQIFSINLLLAILPKIIVSPIVGSLADRYSRKKLVVSLDLLSGLLMLTVYFISYKTGMTISLIYLSTFFLNLLNVSFDIVFNASLPNIVLKENLGKLNSYSQTGSSLSRIIGRAFGGIVFVLIDIRLFILINGISFILSAFSESFIKFKYNNQQSTLNRNFKNENKLISSLNEGFIYFRKNKLLKSLLIYVLSMNFFFAFFNTMFPYIMVNELEVPEQIYGFIQSSLSLGAVVISIILGKQNIKFTKKVLRNGYFSICFLWFLLSLPLLLKSTNVLVFIYLITVGFFIGGSIVYMSIPTSMAFQIYSDNEYRGRVMGFVSSASLVLSPISFLFSGYILDKVDSFLLITISSIILLMISLTIMKNKNLELVESNV